MKRLILIAAALILAVGLSSCPYVVFTIEVTATPESGPAPLEVSFAIFKFEDRGIDTVSWNFGDGSADLYGPFTEYRQVTHEFQNAGVYSVTCLAVDDGVFYDHKAWETVEITVADPESGALVVSIAGDPLSGCPAGALEVAFASTVTGGTPPYTYEWDFGDGGVHRPKPIPFTCTSSAPARSV